MQYVQVFSKLTTSEITSRLSGGNVLWPRIERRVVKPSMRDGDSLRDVALAPRHDDSVGGRRAPSGG